MIRQLRAWDSNNKKWVYSGRTPSMMHGFWKWVMYDSETIVNEETGLRDKNGVEIYEGDMIKAKHDDGHYDVGEVVYGRKGSFCISLPEVATGIKSPLLNYIHGIMFDESDIEVIGNIYESAPPNPKQENE